MEEKWAESAAKRLRKNWTPLAQMHLLLRESGWEPQFDDEDGDDCPYWHGPGPVFVTFQDGPAATCEELRSEEGDPGG